GALLCNGMTCMQAALIAWITIRLWTHFLAYNPLFSDECLAAVRFGHELISFQGAERKTPETKAGQATLIA
ncbi:MAG: hypothetical protein KH146_14555, partial [Eggerthella sp.]|uniref:hypothetical protein n=1 Tax=Eggerthella sp. TaxID=1929886 RepID=UPI001EC838DC